MLKITFTIIVIMLISTIAMPLPQSNVGSDVLDVLGDIARGTGQLIEGAGDFLGNLAGGGEDGEGGVY